MKTPAPLTRSLLNILIGVVVSAALLIIAVGEPRETNLNALWTAGFVFMVAVVVLRFFFVNETPWDRKVNTGSALGALAVALCEPSIAHEAAKYLPGGVAQVLNLWHVFFVLCCFYTMAVIEDLRGERRPPSRLITVGVPALTVAILVGLSIPSLIDGQPMYKNPDWLFAAYFLIYCLVPIALCFKAFRVFYSTLKATRLPREIFGVATILAVSAIGAISMVTIASGAIMMTLGHAGQTLTDATIARVHGGFMLPFLASCLVVLVPSIWTAVATVIRLWIVNRGIRILHPMWQDCTKAVPEVVLRLRPEDKPDESNLEHQRLHLHRMNIEVVDSLTVLAAGVVPLSEKDQTLVGPDQRLIQAVQLVLACRSAGSLAAFSPSETTTVPIKDLAEHWIYARKYADKLTAKSYS